MNKKDWLKSLKKGDTVVSWSKNYLNEDSIDGLAPKYIYKRLTVKNITGNGKIRLNDGTLIDPEDTRSVDKSNIKPLTNEIMEKEEQWRESRKIKAEVLRLFKENNITKEKIINEYSEEKLTKLKEFLIAFK